MKFDDVVMYVRNSNIKGPIDFGQDGSGTGKCAMNAMFNASANMSATSSQNQTTGKKADKKKGTTSGLVEIVIIIIVVIIILVASGGIIYGVYKHNKSKKGKKTSLASPLASMNSSEISSALLLA